MSGVIDSVNERIPVLSEVNSRFSKVNAKIYSIIRKIHSDNYEIHIDKYVITTLTLNGVNGTLQ